jgi:hypothetical protein
LPTSENGRREIDLEDLAEQLSELKRAVHKTNPILRSVAESRLYPALGISMGTVFVMVCLILRKVDAANSLSAAGATSPWLWLIIVFTMIFAGVMKILLTRRIAKKYDDKGLALLMRAIYGGKMAAILASLSIILLALIFFLGSVGEVWYLIPTFAFFASFAGQSLDFLIDLPEYKVLGWSGLAAGVLSLFFVKTDPWLWAAIDAGLVFVAFGAAGLVRASRARG